MSDCADENPRNNWWSLANKYIIYHWMPVMMERLMQNGPRALGWDCGLNLMRSSLEPQKAFSKQEASRGSLPIKDGTSRKSEKFQAHHGNPTSTQMMTNFFRGLQYQSQRLLSPEPKMTTDMSKKIQLQRHQNTLSELDTPLVALGVIMPE